jgi:hypothetical protein
MLLWTEDPAVLQYGWVIRLPGRGNPRMAPGVPDGETDDDGHSGEDDPIG